MKKNSSILKENFLKSLDENKFLLIEEYSIVSISSKYNPNLQIIDYNTSKPLANNVLNWSPEQFGRFLRKIQASQVLVNAEKKGFVKDGSYSVKSFVNKLSSLKSNPQKSIPKPNTGDYEIPGFMDEDELGEGVHDPNYFQDIYEAKYVLVIQKGIGGNDQETSAEIRSIPNVTVVTKEGKGTRSETSIEATFRIKFALERPETSQKYMRTVLNPMLKTIKGLKIKNYLGVKLVKKAGASKTKQNKF